jgi:hypothetical protein
MLRPSVTNAHFHCYCGYLTIHATGAIIHLLEVKNASTGATETGRV